MGIFRALPFEILSGEKTLVTGRNLVPVQSYRLTLLTFRIKAIFIVLFVGWFLRKGLFQLQGKSQRIFFNHVLEIKVLFLLVREPAYLLLIAHRKILKRYNIVETFFTFHKVFFFFHHFYFILSVPFTLYLNLREVMIKNLLDDVFGHIRMDFLFGESEEDLAQLLLQIVFLVDLFQSVFIF